MSIEMDLPEQIESGHTATAVVADPVKKAAKNAATAALESADGPMTLGKEITIRLTCDVVDAAVDFYGHSGETLTAQQDEDGNVWVQACAQLICIGREECEIVDTESGVAATTEGDEPDAAEKQNRADEALASQEVKPESPPPAVAAAAVPRTVDDAEKRRREYLHRKDVLQEQISALMIEQQKLKEQAKLCKKECEVYVEQLNALIEDWENPAPTAAAEPAAGSSGGCGTTSADQPTALATPQADPAGSPGTQEQQPAAEAGPPPQSQAEIEAEHERKLRACTLRDLGCHGKSIERLEDDEHIKTVWDYEQFRAAVALGKKEWPKGFGEKKQEEMQDRIDRFLAKLQQDAIREQANDAIEARQDAEQAAEVTESQPPQPTAVAAVSADLDDL